MPYKANVINELQGLNEDENPSSLGRGQLRIAQNCARWGKMTGTRPGLIYDSEYTAPISGTPPIQGMHEFRLNRDDARDFVVVAGTGVHRTSGAALSTSGTPVITSGADNYWTFADYQNLVWGVGGLQGTDTMWTWDGNPANPVTKRLDTLNLNAKYVYSKFNTIFLGGMTGTDFYDNDMVARYPDYASDATDPDNWPNANVIPGQLLGENMGVGSYGSEFNTGFGSYQDNKGDFLLFLTNRRIIAFRENPLVSSNANRFIATDAIANGCVDQRAFVDLGYDQGDSVYVSNNGIHSMALSQEHGNRASDFLSWPVRKTFESLNWGRLKYTRATYWPTEGLVLFLMSTGSSTTHNLILCMDIKGAKPLSPDTVRWYKWSFNGPIPNDLIVARNPSEEPTIYFGGTAGQVCSFSRTVYSDLGTAISVNFRTNDDDAGLPSVEKSVGDLFYNAISASTYSPTHTFILDDGRKTGKSTPMQLMSTGSVFGATTYYGTGTTYGQKDSIQRDRIRGDNSSYTISQQFSHAGGDEPFFVGQLAQDIAAQGIADEDSA